METITEKKRLLIVSIEHDFLNLLTKQVKDVLGDKIDVVALRVDNLNESAISQVDAILLSSNFIYQFVQSFFTSSTPVLFANRAVNLVNLKRLMELPKGQTLLVINDNRRNTNETVESLREILPEQEIIPFYPDQPVKNKIDYVVTPGEKQLVPQSIFKTIDIGPRVLSLATITEIAETLKVDINKDYLVTRYIKSLVMLSDGIRESTEQPMTHSRNNRGPLAFDDILKVNSRLSDIVYKAMDMAKEGTPLHIKGEAGTGKRMLAEAVHGFSPFSDRPFFCVNCAVTTSEELDEMLFGSNSAVKMGLIEAANGGSILLKNIDRADFSLQEKLIPFVKWSSEENAGEAKVRIMTASCIDLSRLVEMGRFHPYLYRILEAYTLEIPPLRERKEDFDQLVDFFKQRFNFNHLLFTEETLSHLKNYSWPGNVSELFNILSYCACLKESPITIPHLPYYLQKFLMKEAEALKDGDVQKIINTIEQHGFLEESLAILDILLEGKKSRISYGRKPLEILLKNKHSISLTEQQLRKRLEILDQLELINIRQGRSGTTISKTGELFLQQILHQQPLN